ncbi:MAG: YciI family protein [Povalibacter sp.]
MKQYLISMYHPDGPGRPEPEVLQKIMKEIYQIRSELQAAGRWVFAGGLHEADSSTVIRMKGAEALITDGPFAEGKEHIGGITVIRAEDLDEALRWAQRYARATTLPIEVRPFREDH